MSVNVLRSCKDESQQSITREKDDTKDDDDVQLLFGMQYGNEIRVYIFIFIFIFLSLSLSLSLSRSLDSSVQHTGSDGV